MSQETTMPRSLRGTLEQLSMLRQFQLSNLHSTQLPPMVAEPEQYVARIAECRQRLLNVYDYADAFVEGDDLGTTFSSCGAILLAVGFKVDSNVETLVNITRLPHSFVQVVVQIMDELAFLECESFTALAATLQSDPPQYPVVAEFLHCALEEFWNAFWRPDRDAALFYLRDGQIVGGTRQWWIDPESVCA